MQGVNIWNKAGIDLIFYNEHKVMIGKMELVRDEGTHDWTRYEDIFPILRGAAYIKVRCFFSQSSGKAWIDDISVNLLPKYIGKFISKTGGRDNLDIVVNASKTVGELGNVNGIIYESVKKKFTGMEGMKPTIIRTPQIISYYFLIKDSGKQATEYYWDLLDRDLKTIVGMNAVPFISIGWVPALFEKEIERKDYSRWKKFIFELVSRYSKKFDVTKWYWNFWNEPSVFRSRGDKKQYTHWYGTEEEFYEFYRQTADAALEANNNINIGAAGFSENSPWLKRFISWCGENSVRLDFLSWHSYGNVPERIGSRIENIRDELKKYKTTSTTEIIIDEWNSYAGGGSAAKEEYTRGNYAAAYRVTAINEMINAGLAANMWFVTYDESYGVFANGLRQPTYNSFVLFDELGAKLLDIDGYQKDPYVSAIAAINDVGDIGIIIAYFKHLMDSSDDRVKEVTLRVRGINKGMNNYRKYMIGDNNGSEFTNNGRGTLKYTDERAENTSGLGIAINITLKP